MYYWLLVPADDPDDTSCNFSRARDYQLILVQGPTTDSVELLLDEADNFGMDVFVGLPKSQGRPNAVYDADDRYSDTLSALTGRVLRDYRNRHSTRASLRGLYQTFEIMLKERPRPEQRPTLRVYAAQHAAAHAAWPGKPILASPYWDARRDKGTPAAQMRAAIDDLGQSGADIIAPQDGRGTGKVGLFWPNEAGNPVDPRLEPAVGSGTYGEKYLDTTRAYYEAAAQGRDDLADQSRRIELWANIEAFEPAGGNCAADSSRGRTDKARLDKAISFAGSEPTKLISYRWNGFYECRAGRPQSLAEEIAAAR